MTSKIPKKTDRPPDISLIIATYNRGMLLKSLLDNLTNQTISKEQFEVVVVDDGSEVPAEEVVKGSTWPFSVTFLRQENAGAATARHNGILHSHCDIVAIVDDDMVLNDDFLEQHLSAHQAGADVVLGRIVESSNLSEMPVYTRLQQHLLTRAFDRWTRQESLYGGNLYTGNVSFSRDLYNAVGGFDLTMRQSEDRELGVRFEKAGARISFASGAVTINKSDHIDFESWLERARRYGVLDWRISRTHREVTKANPLHFLSLVSPLSRPILCSVMAAPVLASPLSRTVMKVSEIVESFHFDRIAMAGTTLAYGIQYYKGVRDEAGSLGAIWEAWRQFSRDFSAS